MCYIIPLYKFFIGFLLLNQNFQDNDWNHRMKTISGVIIFVAIVVIGATATDTGNTLFTVLFHKLLKLLQIFEAIID